MAENISLSDIIPASPERVYTAWLDAEQHGAMTGSTATDEGDGRFTAWDGYISGRTVSAVPHSKIVQAWRTTEFPTDDPDSILTLHFETVEGGTKVSVTQENLPDGQGDSYAKGWDEFYFAPMKKHFGPPSPTRSADKSAGAIDRVKESVGDALEDAKSLGEATVKAVKKAQKEAAKTIKKVSAQVGKGAKALVARAKKAAKKVAPKKKKKPAPKKKKAAAKKKKKR
ncbi:MAG: SRPBCC domain-containing protein [Archangium sp.]|nr:SRPBCC domain-containing protein [Archangium sp.]